MLFDSYESAARSVREFARHEGFGVRVQCTKTFQTVYKSQKRFNPTDVKLLERSFGCRYSVYYQCFRKNRPADGTGSDRSKSSRKTGSSRLVPETSTACPFKASIVWKATSTDSPLIGSFEVSFRNEHNHSLCPDSVLFDKCNSKLNDGQVALGDVLIGVGVGPSIIREQLQQLRPGIPVTMKQIYNLTAKHASEHASVHAIKDFVELFVEEK